MIVRSRGFLRLIDPRFFGGTAIAEFLVRERLGVPLYLFFMLSFP
jgi:hypothetical protein